MRWARSITLFVIGAVFGVCALASVAGCGGDAGLAKQDALRGDALYNVASGIKTQLDAAKAGIERLMVANDAGGLVAMQSSIQGILAKIDRSMSTIDKALVEYRKVTKFQGVDKYKEYVSIQTEAALKEQQALAVGKGLAAYVLTLVGAAKSGKPVSLNDSLKAVSATVNQLDELERNTDDLKRQARTFALNNDLF